MEKVGFMFFGAKGVKVRIHQDMDYSNVVLTQFHGRKKVVLIAPDYSRLLYKLPFNTHSLVDLDQPDYERYPGLRHIEAYECVLEPGDSVFMPSGYWHYITYLDGGFSVSYRKLAQSPKAVWQGFLSVCIYMPFDKLMHFLFSNKWLEKKEELAHLRAKEEINKHHPQNHHENFTQWSSY
jgi:ribosomal protein L16 Arg81 hydroxylase